MGSNIGRRLEYKQNIREHLIELSKLVGRPVTEAELIPLEAISRADDALQALSQKRKRTFEIEFEEKTSDRFGAFVEGLFRLNPGAIYVWTPKAMICGVLRVSSLRSICFDFEFSINPDGILDLVACDFKDKVLFDFYVNDAGRQALEIVTTGDNWSDVVY